MHCDVPSVFCFMLCVRCFACVNQMLFFSKPWVGGRSPRAEPKDNPAPDERRDRSLKAQGPSPMSNPDRMRLESNSSVILPWSVLEEAPMG